MTEIGVIVMTEIGVIVMTEIGIIVTTKIGVIVNKTVEIKTIANETIAIKGIGIGETKTIIIRKTEIGTKKEIAIKMTLEILRTSASPGRKLIHLDEKNDGEAAAVPTLAQILTEYNHFTLLPSLFVT